MPHRPTRLRPLIIGLGLLLGSPSGSASPPLLQPSRRGEVAPDRAFDILALELDLRLDPSARAVSGAATWTIQRLAPGPLVLDQVGLHVDSVEDGERRPAWWISGDTLVIDGLGAEAKVTVRYSATPQLGLHFREARRGGPDRYDEIWSQGEADDNRHWFPAWDHPNDRFVYTGRIAAPEGWKVLTNSGHDMVSYLVMVAASPDYRVVSRPALPEASVWVPSDTPESAISLVLDPIPEMMAHFAARTGVAYPWGPYRQVFVQRFMYGGMENTSATVMEGGLLLPERLASTGDLRVDSIVAHELAHQWYGDLLTCDTWQELWLNEGFATFMASDWARSKQGPERYARNIRRSFLDSLSGPALAGRFHQGPGAPPNHNVYQKGQSVLHMLRVLLGEETFWAGIVRYTRAHAQGLVTTEDLQRSMEAASGRHLDWFFEQWVELPYIPKLTVSDRYEDGRYKVTIRQETGPERPLYTIPLDVEVGGPSGPVHLRGWLEGAEATLELPLAAPPTYAVFDPEGGVLAEVKQSQDAPKWAAALASTSPYARLVAIEALGQTGEHAALSALLADASAPLVLREAAAAALGEQRWAEPLLAALADPSAPVRRAAAAGLGRCTGEPVVGALRALLLGREPSPAVQAAALRALATVAPKAALPVARPLTRRSEPAEAELRDAAADIVGREGDAQDLPLLLDERAPYRSRVAGMYAAAALAARELDPTKKARLMASTARFAEVLLDDLDIRARQAAIDVLGRVGDEGSVARLEAHRREDQVIETRRAAEAAIAAIRGRSTPAAPAPNEVEARLKALEDKATATQRTLDQWAERH